MHATQQNGWRKMPCLKIWTYQVVAEEFELTNNETRLFYNTEIG